MRAGIRCLYACAYHHRSLTTLIEIYNLETMDEKQGRGIILCPV